MANVHLFARHFHIYFRFFLQVSETLTIFASDYNYQSLNGLGRYDDSQHLSLYNKGVCAAQGNGGFSADLRMASSAIPCVTNTVVPCVKNIAYNAADNAQYAVKKMTDYLAVPNNLLLSHIWALLA